MVYVGHSGSTSSFGGVRLAVLECPLCGTRNN